MKLLVTLVRIPVRLLVATILLLLLSAFDTPTAASAEQAFEKGQTVFTRRSTPLKLGTTTRLDIDQGTRLLITDVSGTWLGVSVRRGAKTVRGWVAAKDVERDNLKVLLDYGRHMYCADFEAAAADAAQSEFVGSDGGMALFAACAHYGAEQYETALAVLDEALRTNPKGGNLRAARAIVLNAMERHEASIADCTEAIQGRYRYPLVYAERGFAHFKLGHIDQCLEDATTAIELGGSPAAGKEPDRNTDDDSFEVLMFRLVKGRRFRIQALRLAVQLNDMVNEFAPAPSQSAQTSPDEYHSPEPYRVRGLALESLGKDDEAFADFLAAVRCSGDPESLMGLSRILSRAGKAKETWIAYHLAALFLLASGDFSRADDCLGHVSGPAPEGVSKEHLVLAYLVRTAVRSLQGDRDKAVAEMETCVASLEGQLEADEQESLRRAYRVLKAIITQRFADGTEALNSPELATTVPTYVCGMLHLFDGQLAEARALFGQDSDNRLARLGLQIVEVLSGDAQKAKEDFRRDLQAVRTSRGDSGAPYLCQLDFGGSEVPLCFLIAFLSDVIRANPRLVEAYVARGAIYAMLDLRCEAIDDLTQAISFNSPCTSSALALRGLLYAADGDDESAQADFARAEAVLAGAREHCVSRPG